MALDLGALLEGLARARFVHTEDPTPTYREAIQSYARAIELEPTCAEAMSGQGSAWSAIGEWQRDHRKDPSEAIREARAAHEAAVAANPSVALHRANLAHYHLKIADWTRRAGKDAGAGYESALAEFDRALGIDASIWQSHYGRGAALEGLGR